MVQVTPEYMRYYRSLDEDPLPAEGVGPYFRDFVLYHEGQIVEIGNTRYTQTNDCRRCVALLPLVMMASFHRSHLIDVGTSAGLNLGLDRYRYRLGSVEWGPPRQCSWRPRKGRDPDLHPIEVLTRTGLDLNPIDPTDEDARRWLDAHIWPEHVERRARLRAALEVVQDLPFQMMAGDARGTLAEALDRLPSGEPAVVVNSFTLGQFTPEGRAQLEAVSDQARRSRPVLRVSMEVIQKSDDWARLVIDDGSGPRTVGQPHPHGEWVELWDQARP